MFKLSLAITFFSINAAFAATCKPRYYTPNEQYVGNKFFEGFNVERRSSGPSHGRVNYVDRATAVKNSLITWSKDTFTMRADSTKVLSKTGPGRDSVRISSKKAYGYGVTILDVRHMPVGCGTWPAFWSNANGYSWPQGGEIDIIEGIHGEGPNAFVLHTSAQCTMNSTEMTQTGNLGNNVCTSGPGSNAGCIVRPADNQMSFGPSFNTNGGGWYAVERTEKFIRMWFWPRNAQGIPDDIRHAATQKDHPINPALWGLPYAHFVNDDCNIKTAFKPQNFIINLTFCGDWAGNHYPSTCPKTCIDHVNEDPADFKDAFWDIASLTMFKPVAKPRSRRHVAAHHQQDLNSD